MQTVYRPRQWLANNTSADGVAHRVNRGGQQGFWSTARNQVFAPIAFSRSPRSLIRAAAHGHSRLYTSMGLLLVALSFGKFCKNLALRFLDRLRLFVWTRCALQLINNIPLPTILAKNGMPWKRPLEESMVARSYKRGKLTAAMAEYAESLLASFSNTFQNRMIACGLKRRTKNEPRLVPGCYGMKT